MNKVILKKGRDWSVRKHHPWIFSGALSNPVDLDGASPGLGETVEVTSAEGETLGYGWFSPTSQIRVRMVSFDAKCVPDEKYVTGLVAAAVGRRADFFVDCSTNGVRLVNAESDGLPGLVADLYNGHVVCQFTSAGAEAWKATIAKTLMSYVPGCLSVSERADIDVRKKEGLPYHEDLVVLEGSEPPELIEIVEGPIRYYVDPRKGHKTGFYLDQRDARAAVGALAPARDVLNCFCYTGGFGLYAAACGASHVTQVDISHDALELAKKNAELTATNPNETVKNFSTQTVFEHVEADVFKYLRQCRDEGKSFDLIVLDPPKFAESKAQVMKAARGYKDINLLAMKLLRPGGILATFSCSGAMTTDLFDKVLAEAAQDAHKDFQMIARTRQGADHPVSLAFPEGLYLKGVILRSMS